MNSRDFLKAGHWPTLLAALLYFDMSFMVWILLGPLGVQIAANLKLDPAAKGIMVALPVLAGALLRVVNGALVDWIGPKRAGLIGQVVVIVGLIAFWASGARSYAAVLSLGLVLGVAGASFAVALPLASRWYPPKYQGLALGLAGAGKFRHGSRRAVRAGPRRRLRLDQRRRTRRDPADDRTGGLCSVSQGRSESGAVATLRRLCARAQ